LLTFCPPGSDPHEALVWFGFIDGELG
jgi:hypothetical protein